jgi:hypothetical protein
VLRASIAFVMAFCLVLGCWRATARADGPVDEARRALTRGDPELAIEILEEARAEDASDPGVRYELYVAYEQAGDLVAAAAHLEAYLGSDAAIDARERRTLEGHLLELRAAVAPIPRANPWTDPAVVATGWTLFVAGIAGLITFGVSAAVAYSIENALPEDCRMDERLCEPGARDGIGTAWLVGGVALGAGVVLGAIGGAILVVADQAERGATRALPPDLDPTVQRPMSLRPWIDPRPGGGGGLSVGVSF